MPHQKRVIWTKGMFLSPQHFQSQDQYFSDLLQFRFGASNFANYGVTQLKIDEEALANGSVKVTAARGFMPDGEPFDMPDSEELPASREIGKHFSPDAETLDVYLALPERRTNARNVTLAGQREGSGPADTRYVAELRIVPDENQGSDPKPVQVGSRSFRLVFGNEFRGGLNSMPLARVSRNAVGKPILHPAFTAPCLDLASSELLMSIIRRQVEILATKSSSLAGPRREKSKGTADFSASDTAGFWLLHTVNSYLPELRHIFKVRHGHPEVAYCAMLRLAGALSTFAIEGSVAELPDYDHDDLGACFNALDARIRELMETVIPDKYFLIPLVRGEGSTWNGVVPNNDLFQNSQFYLAVSAPMGIVEIIQRVPKFLKVAAPGRDNLDHLVDRRLSGITLLHVPSPPKQIPKKGGYEYFALNQSGDVWMRIKLDGKISVHALDEVKDPQLELVVVLE